MILKCKNCNKLFKRRHRKVFCSKKCNIDNYCKYFTCIVCHKEFKILNCEYRKKVSSGFVKEGDPVLFCKRQCMTSYHKGEKSFFYKGGTIDPKGYRRIVNPDFYNGDKKRIIFEHVYIMQKHIGRKLKKHECVHHINRNKLDNRIENLELITRSDHSKLHNKEYLLKNGHRWGINGNKIRWSIT